jgi:ABC-type sulfate transport system permease component
MLHFKMAVIVPLSPFVQASAKQQPVQYFEESSNHRFSVAAAITMNAALIALQINCTTPAAISHPEPSFNPAAKINDPTIIL